jgi:hypothetical protein
MKTVHHMIPQGDLMVRRIDTLPAGAVEVPAAASYVVAHSETGHHHVASGAGLRRYSEADGDGSGLVSWLVTGAELATIDHQRPYDTHEALGLLPGCTYELRRQREHRPDGWAMVSD